MPLAPARYRDLILRGATLHGIDCGPAEFADCCPLDLGSSGSSSGTGTGTGSGSGGPPGGGNGTGVTIMRCNGQNVPVLDRSWRVTLTGFGPPETEFTDIGSGTFTGGWAYGTIFRPFPPDNTQGDNCANIGKPACMYNFTAGVWTDGVYAFKRAGRFGPLVLSDSRDVPPGSYTAPVNLCQRGTSPLLPSTIGGVPLSHNLRTGRFNAPPFDNCETPTTLGGPFNPNDPVALYLSPSSLAYSPPQRAGIVNPFYHPSFVTCNTSLDFVGGCFSACREAVTAWMACENRNQPDGNILSVAYRHRLYKQMTLVPLPDSCEVSVVTAAYGVIFRTLVTRTYCFPVPNPPPGTLPTKTTAVETDRTYCMGLVDSTSTHPSATAAIPLTLSGGSLSGSVTLPGGQRIEVRA